jgi:hypothetical protein
MSEVTAIDLLIEPDAATRERALVLNARLRGTMPEGFAFDDSHAPHITVLQRYVRTPELEPVLDAVGAVVAGAELTSLDLRATRIAHAEWDTPGLSIASLMLGSDPRLLALQGRLIAAIAPFAATRGAAAAFVTDPEEPDVNATTIGYVARFVPDHCASNYEAHLSIGMARRRDLEALEAEPFEPFDVRAEAVAVYQLGNNGTARRRLRAWPVKKGTPPEEKRARGAREPRSG